MVSVLPGRSGKDKVHVRIDPGEDVHSLPLTRNKTMSIRSIDGKGAPKPDTLVEETRRQLLFKFLLRGPASLIRCLTQISARNQDCVGHRRFFRFLGHGLSFRVISQSVVQKLNINQNWMGPGLFTFPVTDPNPGVLN
jgi:hypothetical protein